MIPSKQEYVINKKGERVSVLLDDDDYRKILEELEELVALPTRSYQRTKQAIQKLGDDPRPRGCGKLAERE
jgi:hypothetical protein